MKPKISKVIGASMWECFSKTEFGTTHSGYGRTPLAAYEMWDYSRAN